MGVYGEVFPHTSNDQSRKLFSPQVAGRARVSTDLAEQGEGFETRSLKNYKNLKMLLNIQENIKPFHKLTESWDWKILSEDSHTSIAFLRNNSLKAPHKDLELK